MKTLILTIITLIAINSQAAYTARDVSKLFYDAKCDQQRCQQGVVVQQFETKELFRLPAQLYKELSKVSYDQAQIWGDTILEGDYVADGRTQLDKVTVIKQNARVVGYAVTYSERAWYVGACGYVHRRPDTLVSCEEGRIFERSFVTADLNEAEVDQNQFADFKSND